MGTVGAPRAADAGNGDAHAGRGGGRTVLRPALALAVAVVALVLSGAVIGLVGQADRTPSPTETLPEGYDSTEVAALSDEFGTSTGSLAVVLFTAEQGTLADGVVQQDLVPLLENAVSQQAGPSQGQPSGPPVAASIRPSEDGTAVLAPLPIAAETATETNTAVEELRERLGDGVPEGVDVAVTGPAAVQADLADVFQGADVRLLAATAGIVALLLLITYRSPWLWLVPLTVVGLADQVAAISATHVLAGFGVAWDESTVGILSVLVFGAGTDYSLLLISRYRDELRATPDRYRAMATAVRGTLEAVAASATTVMLGLLTLLLSVVPTTRGLGLACATGILIASCYALVVLPCALVLFGRWIFWPMTPRVGQPQLVDSTTSPWRRLGRAVAAAPGRFAMAAVALVAVLAAFVPQVEQGLPVSEQFLDTPESISAADRVAESFPAGTVDPVIVVAATAEADAARTVAEESDAVASVRPAGVSDGLTRFDLVLQSGGEAAESDVVMLREELAAVSEARVGGTTAEAIDAREAAERDRALLIPIILALVVLGLMVLLRSVVAPLVLVATVVGTFFAALGTAWWVYTGVFDFSGMDVGVPLLAFLFLVALGVDYNIFLITRILEETAQHPLREATLRGLTATGGVITSAGILLAAVFAVLGVLPLVVLAQLGIVIFIGVLLDTLVVRTILVPALVLRVGPRLWWPRRIGHD